MLSYVLDVVQSLKIKDVVVVTGYKDNLLKKLLIKGIKSVRQKRLLGTADAVKTARKVISKSNVLIVYADNPLIRKETLARLIQHHLKTRASCTLLTAIMDNPKGYGRIIRGSQNKVCGIGEEKDISQEKRKIKEINSGVCCFRRADLFKMLGKVRRNNKKREFYLTDVVNLLSSAQRRIETVLLKDDSEVLGINSRQDLARANEIMRSRILDSFMSRGVTIVDPKTVYIDKSVKIGRDTIIHPYTIIEKNVRIGRDCRVGPFCHLRPDTNLRDFVKVGNFAEIVRSTIGKNSRAKHLSYLGDATIGSKVNIGAGTVIANYDGKNKNKTIIKDGAFIGCDTVLIAPIKIGRSSVTGAGSVVIKNRDVPDKTIVAGVPARKIKRKTK
jgi:bifunctional UDP-N-acetylglucosamine pyrophosphorylase/glucosamine-1-phosphate N-acetyltransferase